MDGNPVITPGRLPTVADFRKHGRFHHIRDLDIFPQLPSEILCWIYPDYHFNKSYFTPGYLDCLKFHCIDLIKSAKYEDEISDLHDQKQLLILRVEAELRVKILRELKSNLNN